MTGWLPWNMRWIACSACTLLALCATVSAQVERRPANPYFPTNIPTPDSTNSKNATQTNPADLLPMPDQEKPPYRYGGFSWSGMGNRSAGLVCVAFLEFVESGVGMFVGK